MFFFYVRRACALDQGNRITKNKYSHTIFVCLAYALNGCQFPKKTHFIAGDKNIHPVMVFSLNLIKF